MILILSENGDYTSDLVIDWLNFYNANYIRLSNNSLFDSRLLTINIEGINSEVAFSKINIIWYRRWNYKDNNSFAGIESIKDLKNLIQISSCIQSDANILNEFFFNLFKSNVKWLCNPNTVANSKLFQLSLAKNIGLDIPKTIVTNNKLELESFKKENKIICKPLTNNPIININDDIFSSYTSTVDDDLFGSLPDIFFPSLFQEEIEKEFEIRVFFLNRKTYSMAIFTQFDEKTSVDQRKYNFQNPNKRIPFKLPKDIDIKVKNFMNKIGLNIGVLDLICTPDNKYYFLEVNPQGQFEDISKICGYNLEEKIARFLIDENN